MIETNVQPCTVCGANQSDYLFEKQSDDRGAGPISIYRCRQCKAIYLGKYDTEYDDGLYEYYRNYQGKPKEAIYDPLTVKSYLKVLDLFAQHIPGRTILDVGCGKGDFVDAAILAGWDINGIELAQPAVEIAQGYGLPVERLDFFSDLIEPSSKDIVTLFEVIEHLADPVRFLRRAEEVVKPGGLVYLTTPNYDSLDRRLLGITWPVIHREHLTYFTPETLLSMLRANTGLNVLHSETRNLSVQTMQHIKRLFIPQQKHRTASSPPVTQFKSAVDVRGSIDSSRFLQLIKRGINRGLDATSTGNTVVLLLQRPI